MIVIWPDSIVKFSKHLREWLFLTDAAKVATRLVERAVKSICKKPALLETDFVHLLAVPIDESSSVLCRSTSEIADRKTYLRFYEMHRNFSFPLKIFRKFLLGGE
jgi:hypothetical protein